MNDIATIDKPNCDLCGAPGSVVQQQVPDPDGMIPGDWNIRRCSNAACGVYWLDPAPTQEDLWKAYTRYHTHTRDESRKLEKLLLSPLNRLCKLALWPLWAMNGLRAQMKLLRYMTLEQEPTGKLLDVGCGAGRFLHRMQKRGWQVEGVEFDPQAANKVTQRYGIAVHVGDLPACHLPAESFDAVTLNQVMEHLYDPRATLNECLRILKPGGRLILTTPNVDSMGAVEFGRYWRGWEPPRHLHLFSVAALQRLVQQSGFEVTDARSYSWDAAGVYRVSWMNQKDATGKVTTFDRLRLIFWGYARELREHNRQKTEPNTAQNVLVCARKP